MFPLFAVMNSATVNICVQVFVWIYVFNSQMALVVKNPPANTGDTRDMGLTYIQSLGCEDPLEEGMVTHSRILAWGMPWIEEPRGLQFIGSQRVRHD